ncbi:helix-turn-helix domain-containing protein [Brevibacillus sp. NPDC058079]|uniref:helix-turn-helix domain-containing protein n=1 Tax=Brevibacillus sp. NPDC058079 TaxID=3346330 RepID=UPI0036E1D36B
MVSFGERLVALRNHQKWSQDLLADKLGMNRANISNYERGIITNIPSDVLLKLSSIFNVSIDYLLGITDANMYRQTLSIDAEINNSIKNETTVSSLDEIDLSDGTIPTHCKFSLDGRTITSREFKKMIAFVRWDRNFDEKQ